MYKLGNMPGAGSSTEKLNVAGAGGEGHNGVSGRRRIKPLCKRPNFGYAVAGEANTDAGLAIALVVAIIASVGIILGALIGKDIIHVHSKSTTQSGSALGAATSGTPTTSTRTTTKPTSASQPANTTEPKHTCTSSKDIPSAAKGTWMDPTSWLDMKDFNCTFTDVTVGGLPLVGLNWTWDDSNQANPQVAALNKPWGSYSSRPFRGVNLGGWLSLEAFITPSLFDGDSSIIDEYGLTAKLGKSAAETLEKHYSTFITEADFKAIADAGLDHVRIPFSYWAIKTYDSDPYVVGVSWRYLLRGIEYARKYGLRVNLDLHAVPGSQNGWNHSGKEGKVDWISGPDGATNAQRTLELHGQLSKFFAQDRYKNVVVFYGLVNEPAPTIPQDALVSWTEQAFKVVRDNGVTATQIFSESMRGLPIWFGKLSGHGDALAIDVHEYTLFDKSTISLKHADRVTYACKTWADQVSAGMTGYGPTMVGEWSQADTDCSKYLNGVGTGARWTGTFAANGQDPQCPTADSQCNCALANAPAASFSTDYKNFLKTWAEAQMWAFERGWGWFYWTWKTEDAPLWSYQEGLKGGFMPPKAYERDWDCSKGVQSFGALPEYY
jgi:glucan 1,3-beta-glucosidase